METNIPVLEATKRSGKGTKAVSSLRDEGRLPAVVYGHKKENEDIELSAKDFGVALRDNPVLVTIKVGGAEQHAVIKDIQYNYVGPKVLHVDFLRVNLDEMVKVNVPLEFFGSPAGADKGGKLEIVQPSVTISARADSIPKVMNIQVRSLELGDSIRMKDLELPQGAELVSHPTSIVCRVEMPKRAKVVVAVADEPEAGAAPAEGAPADGAAAAAPSEGK